jgi:hypothetical protein
MTEKLAIPECTVNICVLLKFVRDGLGFPIWHAGAGVRGKQENSMHSVSRNPCAYHVCFELMTTDSCITDGFS